jgi:hypothetical protein
VEASPLRVHASACGLGLDRWPQRADRPSMGGDDINRDTSAGAGVGRPETRHHRDIREGYRCCPGGDADDSNRPAARPLSVQSARS